MFMAAFIVCAKALVKSFLWLFAAAKLDAGWPQVANAPDHCARDGLGPLSGYACVLESAVDLPGKRDEGFSPNEATR
jgi:hypothetical protein